MSGRLGFVSPDKLILTQFNYDGLGPAAFFLAGLSKWTWKQEYRQDRIRQDNFLRFSQIPRQRAIAFYPNHYNMINATQGRSHNAQIYVHIVQSKITARTEQEQNTHLTWKAYLSFSLDVCKLSLNIFVFLYFCILINILILLSSFLPHVVFELFPGTFGLPGSQGTILSFPWDGSAYGYYDRKATKIGRIEEQEEPYLWYFPNWSSSFQNVLLLESPCSFVRPEQNFSRVTWVGSPVSPLRGSHGLSARRARRTKSRGPKGLQLEVGARRAPRPPSTWY